MLLLRLFVCLTVFSTFVQARYIIPSPVDWNASHGPMRQHFISGSNVHGHSIVPDNSCVIQTLGLFHPLCTRKNAHKLAKFILSKKNKRSTRRYWDPNELRKMVASIIFKDALFGEHNVKDRKLGRAIAQVKQAQSRYITAQYTQALERLYAVASSKRIARKYLNYVFKKPVGITTSSTFRGSELYYKYILRSLGKKTGDHVVSSLDLLCYIFKLDFKIYSPINANNVYLARQVTGKGRQKRLFAASGLAQAPNTRNPYPHMDALLNAKNEQKNQVAVGYSREHFLPGLMKGRQAAFLKSKQAHRKIPKAVRRAMKKVLKLKL